MATTKPIARAVESCTISLGKEHEGQTRSLQRSYSYLNRLDMSIQLMGTLSSKITDYVPDMISSLIVGATWKEVYRATGRD